ncbi:SDR family oxidoreductase [Verrucomicrobiota bacterium sgz303538]
MSLLSSHPAANRSRSQSGSRPKAGRKKLKPVEQQTIVLVGASSGMGRATALAAAKRGARVVVAARNREALDALVQEIESAGGQALAIQADVSRFEDVQSIADQAREHFGGFDTWVNFAATALYSPFNDMTPDEFPRIIDVNLLGQAYGAMVALKHLRAKGRGALIFISSVEGEVAMPFHSAYAASKHGINGMFDALRLELAHAGSDVSVTNVMPTGVNTPFFTNAKSKIGVKPRPPKPIYRPEHVADAVLFAAEYPVRELFIGGGAKMFVLMKRLMPRFLDAYLLRAGFSGQRTRQPKAADAPSGLFAPETGDQRIEGDFSDISRHASFYTWLQTHPNTRRLLKAAILLVGIGWLAEKLQMWDRSEAYAEAERAAKRARRLWA